MQTFSLIHFAYSNIFRLLCQAFTFCSDNLKIRIGISRRGLEIVNDNPALVNSETRLHIYKESGSYSLLKQLDINPWSNKVLKYRRINTINH